MAGTECNNSCGGGSSDQIYLGITITLSSADAGFGKTIGVSQDATYTGFTSSNNNNTALKIITGKVSELLDVISRSATIGFRHTDYEVLGWLIVFAKQIVKHGNRT
ncbi:hypothetical protein LZ30DRAFT_778609 [Colletotrichum cereale]|nr:hypothetical protein LZ30DRAFT_778609 [Colletotrichum cereale]